MRSTLRLSGIAYDGPVSAWLDKQNKVAIAVAAAALHALLYLTANHFPLGPARTLELSPLDVRIPFIPETAWLYWSDYLRVFISFQLLRAPGTTAQFVKAFVTLVAVGAIVHGLYPTIYPRQLHPCPVGIDPITRAALVAFRAVDTPASCLPSLHVAASYLAAFACWSQARRWRWMLLGWATGVAVATLTVKQHYFVDLLAGLALAGAVWFLFCRGLPRVHRGVLPVAELSWARTKD